MQRSLGLFTLYFAIIFNLFVIKNIFAQDFKKIKAFGLELLWEKSLEDVSFYARAGHSVDAFLCFSPDGKFLALGTFTGRLILFSARTGHILWKKKFLKEW